MQSLTVGASSLQVAQGLYGALAEFHPEIIGGDGQGYEVRVSLAGERQIVAILDAIEGHVTERQSAALVQLDGRSYTVHPE